MSGNCVIGIDPGSMSGGIAIVDDSGPWATKIEGKTERDVCDIIQEAVGRGARGMIESVGPARGRDGRKQGVASSFKFGRNYGFLRGCLIGLGIPFEEVSPGVWQRALGCLSKGDKNVTKAKAQQLFPHLKITHAVADALLIAEYARRTQPKIPSDSMRDFV